MKGTMTTKRIVIIEGDAFDADAIVAIVKVGMGTHCIGVHTEHKTFESYHADDMSRDAAMAVAVDAWRKAVGDSLSIPTPSDQPDQPEPDLAIVRYWSDEKGRYYETYGGSTIYFDPALGNFIWNEGPPRRKNPLGEGASPIVRVYVDEAGKPLGTQPS